MKSANAVIAMHLSDWLGNSSRLQRIVQRCRTLATHIDGYLLLLLSLSLLALTPLTAPGYFYEAHDGRHSVFYLVQFDAALRDGAIWPTWAMHHIQGYGYPTFLIQAPLGFYLGAVFVWLGAGYTTAVKLTWATGFLAGSWGMYQLVIHWLHSRQATAIDKKTQERTSTTAGRVDAVRLAALIAALLYVFVPYHLVDIYVRAALNDTLLMGWFPWVFLAFDRLLIAGGAAGWPHRLAMAILLLAGTLLTHTFALISFAPLLVTFVLFLLGYQLRFPVRNRWSGFSGRAILAGIGGVGALLLCVSFLLPLFVEGQYLDQQVYVTNTYDFRRHFVQFGQFFSPFWGYGYSDDPIGANDGMSFQIGLVVLVLTMAALFIPWRNRRLRWLAVYLGTAGLLLLFVMSSSAVTLWEAIPTLAVIQFPWRLLALAAFIFCPLAGLVVHELLTLDDSLGPEIVEEEVLGSWVLTVLVIISTIGYVYVNLQPVEPWREDGRAVYTFEREHPDMIAYTEWVQEQPFTETPLSLDYAAEDYQEDHGFTTSLQRLAIIRGVGTVVSSYSRGASFGGVVRVDRPATVRVYLYYFPGWQVLVDGEAGLYHISDQHGLIDIDIPAGEHRIDIRMGTTPVRQIGMAISAVTLLPILIFLFWPSRRVKQRSTT
ncbi:MAG TPA: hypothetical protein P5121_29790 [Caldilineaceae bacterium]|nr:hypothetical protein [Caldilineaceae bacterium]